MPCNCLKSLLFLAMSIPILAIAASTDQTTLGSTVEETQSLNHSAIWGVTQEDWTRYQQIMSTKGHYLYKDLDPVTVLGLNARSSGERNRYAELLAKQEFANTQALILLDQAYNEAFKKLFGHLPIINPAEVYQAKASLSSVSPTNLQADPGDRYVLFASTNCDLCNSRVNSLLADLNFDVSIDIHFTKQDTRKSITDWAGRMQISPAAVETGKITLNPYSQIAVDFGNPTPPSLYFYDKSSNSVSEVR